MFDEPKDRTITMYAVNELCHDAKIKYSITEIYSGNNIASGTIMAKANQSTAAIRIDIKENEKNFYLIEWTFDGKTYKNHYCTNLLDIDYKKYLSAIEKCGFDEFEGFI